MLVIYNSCICLHMASIDIHHITLTIQTADVRPVPLREGPRTEVMLINLNWFPAWRFSGSQILMGSPCSPPLSFQFIACLMEKTNSVKPLMTRLKHQSTQSITSCQYFRFVDVEWIGKTSSRRKLYKCHYKHLPSRIDQASWEMVFCHPLAHLHILVALLHQVYTLFLVYLILQNKNPPLSPYKSYNRKLPCTQSKSIWEFNRNHPQTIHLSGTSSLNHFTLQHKKEITPLF